MRIWTPNLLDMEFQPRLIDQGFNCGQVVSEMVIGEEIVSVDSKVAGVGDGHPFVPVLLGLRLPKLSDVAKAVAHHQLKRRGQGMGWRFNEGDESSSDGFIERDAAEIALDVETEEREQRVKV